MRNGAMPSDLNWCRLWWNYTVCRDAFFMRTCFVDFMILVYVLWIKKSYVWFNEFFSYFNLLLVQCSFLRRRLEQFWFFCVHILNWRFRKLNTWKHPYAALYLAHESWDPCVYLSSSNMLGKMAIATLGLQTLFALFFWNILVDLYDCILEVWKCSSKKMNAQQSTIRYAACSFFQDFVTPNLDTYTGTKHVPATFAVEASDFRVHGSSGFEEMIVICCHGRSCNTRDSSWYSDIWCCTRVHTKTFGEYRCSLKSKVKVVISDGMSRQAVDPTNDVIPRKINQFVTWFSSWINLCDPIFHRFWTIKLHVMYLLDPHLRNSWDNICRMIFDGKRLHHPSPADSFQQQRVEMVLDEVMRQKLDQKTLAGCSPKWLRGGLETNTTNSLALMAIGFGLFQIHDNWEPTINCHTFGGMTWKFLYLSCRRTRWLKLPNWLSLLVVHFLRELWQLPNAFFQHSVGIGRSCWSGFNLINHSMTNTGMILDKYMQMIRIDKTWLRETCRDAQSKQKWGLKVSKNLKNVFPPKISKALKCKRPSWSVQVSQRIALRASRSVQPSSTSRISQDFWLWWRATCRRWVWRENMRKWFFPENLREIYKSMVSYRQLYQNYSGHRPPSRNTLVKKHGRFMVGHCGLSKHPQKSSLQSCNVLFSYILGCRWLFGCRYHKHVLRDCCLCEHSLNFIDWTTPQVVHADTFWVATILW